MARWVGGWAGWRRGILDCQWPLVGLSPAALAMWDAVHACTPDLHAAAGQRPVCPLSCQTAPASASPLQCRCLAALAEWDKLFAVCRGEWARVEPHVRREMAPIAAHAAWQLGDWAAMRQYVDVVTHGQVCVCVGGGGAVMRDACTPVLLPGTVPASGAATVPPALPICLFPLLSLPPLRDPCQAGGGAEGAFLSAVIAVKNQEYDTAAGEQGGLVVEGGWRGASTLGLLLSAAFRCCCMAVARLLSCCISPSLLRRLPLPQCLWSVPASCWAPTWPRWLARATSARMRTCCACSRCAVATAGNWRA